MSSEVAEYKPPTFAERLQSMAEDTVVWKARDHMEKTMGNELDEAAQMVAQEALDNIRKKFGGKTRGKGGDNKSKGPTFSEALKNKYPTDASQLGL